MKKVTVLILSIFVLSSAVMISVNAKDSQKMTDIESKEYVNELRGTPPAEDDYQLSVPMTIEQSTYTDMWLKSNKTWISTASTSWTNMLGMSTSITIRYPSDLLIMFSSEVASSGSNKLHIRILVDGVEAQPGKIMFISRIENFQSHSFNFYKTNVPAGRHDIKVQWRSELPSPDIAIAYYRTLNIIVNGAGHP